MPFNLRVIEYPNGTAQIRVYSEVLRENIEVKEKKQQYMLCPFTNDMVIDKGFINIQTEHEQFVNNMRSLNRTKQAVFSYSRCVKWEYFVTFTFNKDYVSNREDFEECSKKVRVWLNHQKARYAPDLLYVVVPEQHKKGGWHFHGLLANIGNIEMIDSGHKDRHKRTVYNMGKFNYGFTTATEVTDFKKVAMYIGKYITKDLVNVTKNRPRYFVSKNIPQPTETKLLIEPYNVNDYINTVAESLGKKITRVSQTRDNDEYMNTKYIELDD